MPVSTSISLSAASRYTAIGLAPTDQARRWTPGATSIARISTYGRSLLLDQDANIPRPEIESLARADRLVREQVSGGHWQGGHRLLGRRPVCDEPQPLPLPVASGRDPDRVGEVRDARCDAG